VTTTFEEATVLTETTNAGVATTTVRVRPKQLTLGTSINPFTVLSPGAPELHWITGTASGAPTWPGSGIDLAASLVGRVDAIPITSGRILTGRVIAPGIKATLDELNARVPLKACFETPCSKSGIRNGSFEVHKPVAPVGGRRQVRAVAWSLEPDGTGGASEDQSAPLPGERREASVGAGQPFTGGALAQTG
jgi:hypothetical protein